MNVKIMLMVVVVVVVVQQELDSWLRDDTRMLVLQ